MLALASPTEAWHLDTAVLCQRALCNRTVFVMTVMSHLIFLYKIYIYIYVYISCVLNCVLDDMCFFIYIYIYEKNM